MKASIVQGMQRAQRLVRAAGPYLLIELVLPGGTLIALVLYLYRNGHLRSLSDLRAGTRGALRTASRLFDQLAMAWQPLAADATHRRAPLPMGAHLLLPGR
ncbi:MAG: hypothetical protein U1F48_14535 [Burkholderiales bacterium]